MLLAGLPCRPAASKAWPDGGADLAEAATIGRAGRFRRVEPKDSPAARRLHALEQIALLLRAIAAVLTAVFVTWLLGDVLLLIFAAALIAVGLRGLAVVLSRTAGIKPGLSLAIIVTGMVVLFGLGTVWAGPRLVSEAPRLHQQILRQMSDLHAWLDGSSWGDAILRQLPADLGGSAQGPDIVPRISGIIAGALWSGIGVLGTIVLAVAAALYFAAGPDPYINGPLRLIPSRHRRRARHIAGRVGHALQSWLAGQLVDMLVVGLVIGGGLTLLGVPLPFILAVIAGLLNFVPYIGAVAGAVPAVLVALSQGPRQALSVAALFVIVQLLEGNLLSPLIQRRAVNLPPAATILAQTVLGALFGLPGIILATPIAAAILTALREVTSDAA